MYDIADQLQLLGLINKECAPIDLANFCSSTGFQWNNG
ncbi:hypothetical protein SynROS8604_00233 [Synechococcus sp. ROS8604]|nr:hypothetical protein SynROS8604_00233 [Synechococcus sp. ROS8604]